MQASEQLNVIQNEFMEEIDARGENDEPVVVHEKEELTTEKVNEGEEKE